MPAPGRLPRLPSNQRHDEDKKRFIADLEDFLPFERHIFNPDGSYADKTETMAWGDDT
jgi:hypothetical protein